MAYVALYRTWRPQNFDSVIGQPHIVRTLKNAIEKNKTAHAYLFSGPRGTGKTSTAKILAKALNCVHGPTTDPCGTCDNCRKITDGTSMDVLEIDAASNRGIDEIRGLRETVGFLPVDGRYKVYIIDEVHMLTTEAFNALLKTLEEPPPHILFILATTEPHKIPATIENMKNAKKILTDCALRTAVIATTDYHIPRSLLIAKRLNIPAAPAPAKPARRKRTRIMAYTREAISWGLLIMKIAAGRI